MRSGRLPLTLVVALTVLAPVGAQGQSTCDVATGGLPGSAHLHWPSPLDRKVRVDARDVSLRTALDRIAAAAGLRLSWSAEQLPLERTVCVDDRPLPVGDLLAEALHGTAVEPVVAGNDLVVLAPARTRPVPREPVRDSVVPLEPVVVDAHPLDPARRELPVVPAVLEGRRLAQGPSINLAQALNGAVPGLWVWGNGSGGPLTQFGSLRGATSFGMSAPKVYIDGIEVANPLLLARLSPDAIERVEVIRGPQGAALYGADAIAGVTSITTRHDWVDSGQPRFRVRSNVGFASSDYATSAALAQDHSFGLRLGSTNRSAMFNLNAGTAGDFIPGAYSRHVGAEGALRFVGDNSVITGTLRFLDERAGTPLSPLLSDSIASLAQLAGGSPASAESSPLGMRMFTAGMRASWTSGPRWTHTAVLGVDGYAIDGVPASLAFGVSPADSALRAAGRGALRGTLRISSAARLDLGHAAAGTVTVAAEHTELRQLADTAQPQLMPSRSSTGVSAQADIALRDRVFLTGGLRLEHNGTLESAGLSALPMLGASWLTGAGPIGVKFRAAWGRGIRWPDLPAPAQNQGIDIHEHLEQYRLGPEVQSGLEGGVDLAFGRSVTLQLTRFDQTASGLVQRVITAASGGSHQPGNSRLLVEGSPREPRTLSSLQNVGVIANRGWEMQAALTRGPLEVGGTLSLVDSRVRRLAAGYGGDLREGDRMLGVPARTFGLSATWSAETWSASIGAAGASDWVNYDRIGIARAASDAADGEYPAGATLRSWWRTYDGVTHLRATLARDIGRGLTLLLSGENLLDRQLGEPDNITVLPGRTLTLGLRASF